MTRRMMAAAAAAGMALLNATGVAAAGTLTATAVTRAEAHGSPAAGNWGKAEQVPGLAALNKGGSAELTSISCASPGNCSGGGNYFGSRQQAFVVTESNGSWGTAEQVPGLSAFHQPGQFGAAGVTAVSCTAPGSCTAGGFYYHKAHDQQGFVVTETGGRWGNAQQIPGLSALNTEHYAGVTDISCASPGNCAAGGSYSIPVNGFAYSEAFVVDQVNGIWGKAQEVPGTAALNVGGVAGVTSVSCASPGNCAAGGSYAGSGSNVGEAFVVNEVNGTWQKAEEVPGTAALNVGGDAAVLSVSCASAGNCSAGGEYTGHVGKIDGFEAFVVSEVKGTWQKAEEVPGTAALNKGVHGQVSSVSCRSAGNCSAVGNYFSKPGQQQVFAVNQVSGTWRTAVEIPGSGALNKGGFAFAAQVSCASPGNCAAGGAYAATPIISQAFVVSEVNGTWGRAEQVPGSGALNNAGFAATLAVSCPAPGGCAGGGDYTYRASAQTHHQSAFVVSQATG